MKYRSDFVTNSSSSSFIIQQCGEFPDIFAIAEAMIPSRNWDDDDAKAIEVLNKTSIDRNTPVMFRSSNYNTKIIKRDDKFYIETCNNHRWKMMEDNRNVECTGEGGLDKMENDFEYESYFLVEYNTIFKGEGHAIFIVDCDLITQDQMFMVMHHFEMNNCNRFKNSQTYGNPRYQKKPFNVTVTSDSNHIILSGDRWGNSFLMDEFLRELNIEYEWM